MNERNDKTIWLAGRKATLPATACRCACRVTLAIHSVIKSDYPFWHCCYAVEIKLLLKAASLLLVKLRAKSPSEGFTGRITDILGALARNYGFSVSILLSL
ncbi:hypothetical protein [Klebsiella pneumoniae]|uniref:hypothetical protein n=1 Tax=Klebsiella pneumoniae TaxID=573 RepID=UPI000F627BB2|nr:hypothetical protein [Klebsiella pneumoniae]